MTDETSVDGTETETDESQWTPDVDRVLAVIDDHVLGQRQASEQLLAAYMAGGHALLEGIPGIGKTLLARSFAAALGLDFRRVQFTPDLMPADVLGTNVYDREKGAFRWMQGPIFTQILMADEINRTPPKTQAALLEGMQEGQVSLDGERHDLDPSFFVVATQNPLEFEGTYPLPEAQLDRFLLRIEMSLPSEDHELELYRRALEPDAARRPGGLPDPVLPADAAARLRSASREVRVAEDLSHEKMICTVSDNGMGIEERFHNKVFQIFQKAHDSKKIDSNGIGLSLVKKIVEQADGVIALESQPGKGTSISFTWPLYVETEQTA